MPLAKAQCPNCNGTLEIDNAKEAAICPFCGTPYIVENAINNFITQNQYSINHADINIVGEDIEKMIADAEVFLYKLKNIEEAKKRFESIAEKYPNDYRGWWGISEVYLKIAEGEEDNYALLKNAEKNAKNAMIVAPEDIVKTLNKNYNKHVGELTINKELNGIEDDIKRSMEKINGFEDRIKTKSQKPIIKGNLITLILFLLFLCFSIVTTNTTIQATCIVCAIAFGVIIFFRNVVQRVENANVVKETTNLLNKEKTKLDNLLERKNSLLQSNDINDNQ